MPATRPSNRKRKRDPSETAAAQLRQCLAENARLRKDPYGLETPVGSIFSRPHCTRSSHARRKNCANDIFCLYGLGEGKEGIWHRNPPQIRALGPDPRLSLRVGDSGKAVEQLRTCLERLNAPAASQDGHGVEAPQLEKLRPAGLSNLGATCYVSSLLQGLFHNPVFRRAIYSYPVQLPPIDNGLGDGENAREESIVGALQDLFCAMDISVKSACDPTKLLELLGIKHSEQQDAQEFNVLFLAKLERTLKRRNIDTLRELFQGRQAYVTECQRCRKLSCREETMDKIEINVQGCSSVADAIDAYCATELLEGDNQYFCDGCKEKTNASRKIQLRKLPKVLNVQLLRYVYDRKSFKRKKLKDRIQLDRVVRLGAHTKRVPEVEEYNLVAVLYHRGASAYGGHYVAEVRDWTSSGWWAFDDESVKPLEAEKGAASATEDTPSTSHKNSQDAYMLIYAQSGFLEESHNAGEAPVSALKRVLEEDMRVLEDCEAYARRFEDVSRAIQERKDLYEAVFSNDFVPSTPRSSHEPYHFVGTDWLKSFVTGYQQMQDVDEDVETVFSDKPLNAPFLCPHEKHLHPMKTTDVKIISGAAFNALATSLGYPDFDINGKNYRCHECVQGLARENSDEEQGQRRLVRILGHLEQLDSPELSEGFLLSRAWATKFKQSMESLLRHVTKQNGSLSKATSSANGTQSTLTDIWTNPSSRVEEKLDIEVNTAIRCEHGNLTISRARYIRVSVEIWNEIKAAFPRAIEFSTATPECSTCFERESQKSLDKQSGKEARTAELSSHRDVKQLRQRKQPVPPVFLQLEDHAPSEVVGINDGEVFYVIEQKWVLLWRSYHATQKEVRPRSIQNHGALCEHGKLLLGQQMLEMFTKPQRGEQLERMELQTGIDGLQNGVEPVEIVTEECWRELKRMYGTSQKVHASGSSASEAVEVVDEDVVEICKLEEPQGTPSFCEIRLVWTEDHWDFRPELCHSCMETARKRYDEQRSNFIEQHVRIVQLKDGEEVPAEPLGSEHAVKCSQATANGNIEGVDSLQNIGKPRRNRTRRRRRGQGKPIMVLANHTDTVMQLKLKIWEELSDDNASPNRQELSFDGRVLLDNDVTLQREGIKENDTLYLRILEDAEDQDSLWFTALSEQESSDMKTEVGFKGTFLHS